MSCIGSLWLSFPRLLKGALLLVLLNNHSASGAPVKTESLPIEPPLDEAIDSRSPYLLAGAYSLDVAFPGGGATTGTSAAGVRFLLTDTLAAAVALQLSYDEKERFSAVGATVRAISFMKARGRTNFYGFGQLSSGQTRLKRSSESASSNTADEETSKVQLALAAGAGFEIFLLPELSTSAEVGVGANILPSNAMTFSTGTAGIALHYFLLPD
jgi:hypothetical protein